MSAERVKVGIEQQPHGVVVVSGGEILHNPDQAKVAWSDEIADNSALLEQITERANIARHIDEALTLLNNPTTTIEDAIAAKQITERQTEKVYDSLTRLLTDNDYKRLALYLPFELLPPNSWHPNDEYLHEAIDHFLHAYLDAWQDLLVVQDVRANFVDGDVLETELRTEDLPRVVKAAHLIPKLVERGMLTVADAIGFYTDADEPLLKKNISESLLVLADMGYVTFEELSLLGITDTASDFKDNNPTSTSAEQLVAIGSSYNVLLAEQQAELEVDATVNRKTWLKRKMLDEAIGSIGKEVADVILDYKIGVRELNAVLPFTADSLAALIVIEGVQTAIERAAQQGDADLAAIFGSFGPEIAEPWTSSSDQTKEALTKMFRRVHKLGLISEEQLTRLGIDLPKLVGSLSENLASMPDVIAAVESMTQIIATDPHLSAFMVPVISIGGSRLKGYGEQTSDIDLCVFIKPGVSYSTRRDMRAYISEFFKGQGMEEHPIELWLDDANETLTIRDFNNDDQLVADSTWTHILFDTVLIGDDDNVQMLTQKLLPNYFRAQEIDEFGWSPRAFYLERIEQNLLQYRLLHKGYERHYPRVSKIGGSHADLIDGASVFWDSGYRRLATKLFVDRVFLPKI
jgi:predicted nucleotidyltransferase